MRQVEVQNQSFVFLFSINTKPSLDSNRTSVSAEARMLDAEFISCHGGADENGLAA
jgi:hypothetical protein